MPALSARKPKPRKGVIFMVAVITDALADLGPDLLAVAAVGLGVGISIFGLKKGYKLVRSFIN